ncbi:MAG: hypothetical protein HFE78_04715 [Clostridiales bacterium]|nr:hypothetical protein [Clostridiales bacterium]
MKKSIYERYFNSGKLGTGVKICYFIFIIMIIISIFMMTVIWGVGPLGGMIFGFAILGMVLTYFVQECKLVSDIDYDHYMSKQLQKEDYNDDYSFTVYGESTTGRVKQGKDNCIRTDCYYQTDIILQKKSIIIYVYSICNEIQTSEKYEVPIEHVSATLDSRSHTKVPKYKFEYMTIYNDKTPVCEFPVPPKNYDVEMLYSRLVS